MTASCVVSGKIAFQLVAPRGPATLMAVAGGLIEELLMMQRQQRAVAIGLQRDRHQRLAFRGRMPCPAEHQKPVRARGEAGVGGGAGFDGHFSSSTKAARRSRLSDQKRW